LYQHSEHRKHYLSQRHEEMLFKESGIGRDVAAERDVRTVTDGRELPEGFSWRQRRRGAGLLFTIHRPGGAGETSWSFRPDDPDPENPKCKYEQPSKYYGGPGNVLDVHPRMRHLIRDCGVPVIFVEGIKKADSITSAARAAGEEVLVVAITGVWNWMSEKKPIPDMFEIPVEGRRATICFDSDKLHNSNVQDAERHLAGHLAGRGAEVWCTYLPDKADGSKMGADDFFVAGGTFSELRLLTRRYDPDDVVTVRLSRDERLQLGLEYLEQVFWGFEWKGMGGHSTRDAFKVALDEAAKSGKPHKDGVRIIIAQRRWARLAKVSIRTLGKALDRLEEWGLGYRDNEDRKPEKPGAFVLRASVGQYGEKGTPTENETKPLQTSHGGVLHLRAPRLRWSDPGRKPSRGTVKGTRRVRESAPSQERPAIKRLGKIRGAALDALDKAGGSMSVEELCEALQRKRPRDFRRRTLPLLEESKILTVSEAGNLVSLTDDWLARLGEQCELGREKEADERERQRHRQESHDYRAGLEAIRRSHEKRAREMRKDAGSIEDLERVGSADLELVAALREFLRRNPHRHQEPPGWYAVALWAHGYVGAKPSPRDVEVALFDLREAA
jgi:hypothetical protein